VRGFEKRAEERSLPPTEGKERCGDVNQHRGQDDRGDRALEELGQPDAARDKRFHRDSGIEHDWILRRFGGSGKLDLRYNLTPTQIPLSPLHDLMTDVQRKIRVLVAKPGLDGHDRGAKVIARALRDAGMEVVYTGLRQTPEMVAEAALQEDVDVVGLSILSGAHMALVPKIIELLRANAQTDVRVFVGGIIPNEDISALKALGVTEVFGPGASTQAIVEAVKRSVE
jgi:methylmalonyl-CoA mutase, C-terminal domain